MTTTGRLITLTEFQPTCLGLATLPYAAGLKLWREFGTKIHVEFPSPRTGDQWQLTPLGWVGTIPLTPQITLYIQPKVPLKNLFQMWVVAYRLQSFIWLDGYTHSDSLTGFYDHLATILANRVLARGRKGLHRGYINQQGDLTFVRGRFDLRRIAQRPYQPALPCRYKVFTADIADNQILAYTLGLIAGNGRCSPATQAIIKRAYRLLAQVTSRIKFMADDCNGRFYSRLNQDYQVLHALCRFFLDQEMPYQQFGDRQMLPFLVNMARLYELFVAEWLKLHLPPSWHLKAQEHVQIGQEGDLHFDIDLVLYDATGLAQMVLDTKYKTPNRPGTADVSQVIAYAKTKRCREALLIYPAPLPKPLDAQLDDLRVRSITFSLDRNPTLAGQAFLAALGLNAYATFPAPHSAFKGETHV